MKRSTTQLIEDILQATFNPSILKVDDDSALHHDHPEAKKSGGGHFSVLIVSDDFKGKSSLVRHRLVYAALEKELKSFIHALSIKAYTLDDFNRFKTSF